MRSYLWVALIALVAANIYAIYSLFRYKAQLKEGESDEEAIDNLLVNLNSRPLESIIVAPQCPADFVTLKLGTWPGIAGGCYCPNATTTDLKFKSRNCLAKEIASEGCKDVPQVPAVDFSNWKGKQLCGKFYDQTARPERRGDDVAAFYCPDGFKSCYEDLCVPEAKPCPISGFNYSNITAPSNVTEGNSTTNGTSTKNNTTSSNTTVTGSNNSTPANTSSTGNKTNSNATSGWPTSSNKSKVVRNHRVIGLRAGEELLFIDGNTTLQVLRDNTTRPIINFYISRAAVACFNQNTNPTGGTVYPLTNQSNMEKTCQPWGFDSLNSHKVDEVSERDLLTQNKIYPGAVANIPEFDSYLNGTQIYLISRGKIKIAVNDLCVNYDVSTIGNFRSDYLDFKTWLLIIEIIHGVLIFVLLVSFVVIYELIDNPAYKALESKAKLLAFVGLAILLAFTAARFFVIQSKIDSIEESTSTLKYFVEGKCLEDFRYSRMLGKNTFDPVYLSINEVNKLVFWVTLGISILIMGLLFLQDYQKRTDVGHVELVETEDHAERRFSPTKSSIAQRTFQATRVRVQQESEREEIPKMSSISESVFKSHTIPSNKQP